MEEHRIIRVAAGTVPAGVADVQERTNCICSRIDEATSHDVALLVFPELSICSASCADLWTLPLMNSAICEAVGKIVRHTLSTDITIVLGAPVPYKERLLDCALVVRNGKISGIVPKTHIPPWQRRWFSGASDLAPVSGKNFASAFEFAGFRTLLSTDFTININGAAIGFETGEDAFAEAPVHERLAQSGATIIAHPAAIPATVDKYGKNLRTLANDCRRLCVSLVSCNAGNGESTGDFVFDGVGAVIDKGDTILESKAFEDFGLLTADIEIGADTTHVVESAESMNREWNRARAEDLWLSDRFPFIPDGDGLERALDIQAAGLAARLKHIGCSKAVIGISGGLDSTLAILCAKRAFEMVSLPCSGITGVTMPGFGTSDRTHDNAGILMKELGITALEISIADACRQHLADIGHDGLTADICYENAQARERTQILMDLGNRLGAIIIGTGDLSEMALGWCTYNGDHMSSYGVNASIPKTLARAMVEHCADIYGRESAIGEVLQDIVQTPVSPELTGGNDTQKTEDILGPYELHDWFIYGLLHKKMNPEEILKGATEAFKEEYDEKFVSQCLCTFLGRFFSQQFKRSCSPDAPQVSPVSLSPRYGWQMPSDVCAALWKTILKA